MKTQLYPVVQFFKNTWEIDEFECASVFVLEGEERALVIDAGAGIGDMAGAIRSRITQKPLTVVATHGHIDHVGGMEGFAEYYMDERDFFFPEENSAQSRRDYAAMIAKRQNGLYPYDPQTDITDWTAKPRRLKLEEGMEFDLGGRVVKSFHCPGHTPGQTVFLDEYSGSLICGDALNCNLLYGGMPGGKPNPAQVTSIERTLKGLERMDSLKGKYERIYNGHHDYRPLGAPLDGEVLPDAITLLKQIIDGRYNIVMSPNPMYGIFGGKFRPCVKKGMTEVVFNPDTIFESQLAGL